jgi:glycogen phosphorylase
VAPLVDRHHAEGGRLVARHLDAADGALAAVRHVVGQHQRVVHLVDVVAGQHDDVVGTVGGDDVLVLVDRVGGAAVPALFVEALLRRQQVDELVHLRAQEGPAALQVAQQAVALVLGDHADAPDAGVQAVRQREVDDAELAAEVHPGLGAPVGELLQAAAAPAGQHQRDGALGQVEVARQVVGVHRCSVIKYVLEPVSRFTGDAAPERPKPLVSSMNDNRAPHPLDDDVAAHVERHLLDIVGVQPGEATADHLLQAVAWYAREHLSRRWVATDAADRAARARRVNYLSMEFLIGRTLGNALAALGLQGPVLAAAADHALRLEDIQAQEPDAALGNGGLGRLAACFLDAMAELGLPSFGYGIRYEFGMFEQTIQGGRQVEHPDPWLENGTPWEFPRHDVAWPVRFGGWVEHTPGGAVWHHAGMVNAKAYDMVVPAHGGPRVSTLRLWRAAAPAHIDLHAFNSGDYARAAEFKNEFENISWVLYPNDSTPAGRELRLRQEYFFTSASIQDILARHLREHGRLDNLADRVAIHLNDTHPAVGVAELMRLLVDEHGMAWDAAWTITQSTFSYTNHTLMPEALETWPVALIEQVLPRHMEIVYRLNHDFLLQAARRRPGDVDFLARLSLIEENGDKRLRMAHLSIVGSHKVNGVSALHSQLLVDTIFRDFAAVWPERFTNVTNGVTPRRWLAQANPGLAALLDEAIGRGWRRDLDALTGLRALAGDAGFGERFLAVKRDNKARLARLIRAGTGTPVDPASLFDVQVKRIHEYKRQLLNVLHVVSRYLAILDDPQADWVPRTVVFAGKAASSYATAKAIIRLIHDVGAVVNHDLRVGGRLAVVFVPNYGVSVAETVMPGADLSEQISTAGTEASGTGNMKLALNGALTIGTDDGANIEIRQQVGDDNIFIFGKRADEVAALRADGYRPADVAAADRGCSARWTHRRRPLLARRARALPRPRGLAADARPLPAAGRLRRLRGHAGARRRPVPRPGRVGHQGHPQRRRHGAVLGRPHDRTLRTRDLARRAGGLSRTGAHSPPSHSSRDRLHAARRGP